MRDPLLTAIDRSHGTLHEQLATVGHAVSGRESNQAITQKTDEFMIHACRHASAICAIVLPAVRRTLPDGPRRVRMYVRQVRQLERSVAQAKRRLYGESRSIRLPWSRVWAGLGQELAALMVLERAMLADLAGQVGPRVGSHLAERLMHSEAGSPTRPHPNSPHTGWAAPLTRTVWIRADRFWDAVEGRIVTEAAKAITAPARFT